MKSKISDVAKLANVSKSTISNYLNGRYENMSDNTKKKIEAAIKELNYTPNITARRLSSKIKCNVVCLVIPLNIADTFETAYYPVVLSSVGKASAQTGYNILIYARGGDNDREMTYLKGMANSMADGFLLFDLKEGEYSFQELQAEKIPYVCVGKYPDIGDYNYVASDHGKAVGDAVKHLTELGHRRIGIMLENDISVVAAVRKRAFENAMNLRGIPVRDEYIPYIVPHGHGKAENFSACQRMLSQEHRPTAIIVPSSELYEIENVAKQNHLSIPGDLSVVALDYNKASYSYLRRNYTRVDSIADIVAQRAFKKLLRQIDHREEVFDSELLPLQLIVGDSTAPPAQTESSVL